MRHPEASLPHRVLRRRHRCLRLMHSGMVSAMIRSSCHRMIMTTMGYFLVGTGRIIRTTGMIRSVIMKLRVGMGTGRVEMLWFEGVPWVQVDPNLASILVPHVIVIRIWISGEVRSRWSYVRHGMARCSKDLLILSLGRCHCAVETLHRYLSLYCNTKYVPVPLSRDLPCV